MVQMNDSLSEDRKNLYIFLTRDIRGYDVFPRGSRKRVREDFQVVYLPLLALIMYYYCGKSTIPGFSLFNQQISAAMCIISASREIH